MAKAGQVWFLLVVRKRDKLEKQKTDDWDTTGERSAELYENKTS